MHRVRNVQEELKACNTKEHVSKKHTKSARYMQKELKKAWSERTCGEKTKRSGKKQKQKGEVHVAGGKKHVAGGKKHVAQREVHAKCLIIL